ncbi:MAG: hypothetical protein GY928_04025, partial [Colwellia sp.]|nr:hypothetical protein [Colwellia sp.]
MARKRRRTKSKQPRAKPVKLSPKYWVSGAKAIREHRDSMLVEQEGRCAISHLPLSESNSVLDHCHADGAGTDGRCRGVLESQVNMLEGRYLKLFKKAKLKEKFGLDFPSFLVNMGLYLQQDNSKQKFHYAYMDD